MAIWKDIVAKDSNQPETAAGSPPPVNRPRPEVVANMPAPVGRADRRRPCARISRSR